MEFNLILAGVGGQGILTIAQAISLAAMRRGWNVKQAEVHGMSQRGGEVQSHLRIADGPIHSDLIPKGRADMILAVEPLEALRYVEFLSNRGTIVASTVPFMNIPTYPAVENVLAQIAAYPRHILIDADRLARAAGSGRAVNTVMLGAAATLLPFDVGELDTSIAEMFGHKGANIVGVNQRACRFGRNAAAAYGAALQHGAKFEDVRHWVETLSPEVLASGDAELSELPPLAPDVCELSRAEAHALAQMLDGVYQSGRRQLFEHEVYQLVEFVGAISPPVHQFVPPGEKVDEDDLARFDSDRVVLKIVSPTLTHKSDAGAVVFVPKEVETVNRRIAELTTGMQKTGAEVAGVLVVEFVDTGGSGFGQELFVGIRSTREFGAIIAAGLGGVNTEYLASKMLPGIAVAKALASDTSPEAFFELFKKTAAYDVISGRARGARRVVSDGELLRCFRAFIAIARRFCVDRGVEGPDLEELEVNPFAFSRQRLVPLDGRGRLAPATKTPTPRPIAKLRNLIEPRTIAIVGVSTKRANFGRIILDNVCDCGFDKDSVYVVKDGVSDIDGVRCVPEIAELPENIDLLVAAVGGAQLPGLVDDVVKSRNVASVILIPGGLGEKEGTEDIESRIKAAIESSRGHGDGGPVFLGGNCMGVRSRPGSYDTFFIPQNKLDPRRKVPPRRAALISQSGAFIISRMSNLETLDPTLAVSLGNQVDLTVSDFVRMVGDRADIDCIGVYVEGFKDLDGLAFVRAVKEVTAAGKVVVFYKAGRTAQGRDATAGHTHSVAGDYDVCQTAVANAGGIVCDTFKEFEQLMALCTCLHDKPVAGRRIGAISNAGFETVGMADTIRGARYEIELASPAEETIAKLTAVLESHKLSALVNVRNPLDLTPMADESAFEGCIEAMLADAGVDALIASVVPLTPQLLTTNEELTASGIPPFRGGTEGGSSGTKEMTVAAAGAAERRESLAEVLPRMLAASRKPMVAVVDSGAPYAELVHQLREGGVPTFHSADQAVRSLGRYLCYRADRAKNLKAAQSPAAAPAKPAADIPLEVHA